MVAPRGRYLLSRFSCCQGTSSLPWGRALDHACKRFGWLVLNGHSPSDTAGQATYYHHNVAAVLHLVIVPCCAIAAMCVVPSPSKSQHVHAGVFSFLCV